MHTGVKLKVNFGKESLHYMRKHFQQNCVVLLRSSKTSDCWKKPTISNRVTQMWNRIPYIQPKLYQRMHSHFPPVWDLNVGGPLQAT